MNTSVWPKARGADSCNLSESTPAPQPPLLRFNAERAIYSAAKSEPFRSFPAMFAWSSEREKGWNSHQKGDGDSCNKIMITTASRRAQIGDKTWRFLKMAAAEEIITRIQWPGNCSAIEKQRKIDFQSASEAEPRHKQHQTETSFWCCVKTLFWKHFNNHFFAIALQSTAEKLAINWKKAKRRYKRIGTI